MGSLKPAYGLQPNDIDLGQLQDVDTTGVEQGFQLYWDATSSKWIVAPRDGGFLGIFATPGDLATAYPTARTGDNAKVTSTNNSLWYWDDGGSQWVDSGTGSFGDMLAAVYDPQNKNADAFDRGNMTGFQAISTITGLQSALDSKVAGISAADASITIAGTATNPTIQVSAVLQSTIGSAVQPGANVSVFNNDANYVATGANVSVFNNDANYVATGANVSVFNNDANYVATGANVSVFANDAGYVNAAGASAAAPIQSISGTSPVLVSSPTGTPVISLTVAFVGLVNSATQPGDNVSTLNNDAGYLTASSFLMRATNIDLTEYTTTSAGFVNAGGGATFPVISGQTYIIECVFKGTEINALFSTNEHESRLLVGGVQFGGDAYFDAGNDSGYRETAIHMVRYTAASTGNIAVQLQHARAASGTTYTRDIIYKITREIG